STTLTQPNRVTHSLASTRSDLWFAMMTPWMSVLLQVTWLKFNILSALLSLRPGLHSTSFYLIFAKLDFIQWQG
ncbi:hypothetical protein BgiBS90_006448, partial [Biomphalaria glabrata]